MMPLLCILPPGVFLLERVCHRQWIGSASWIVFDARICMYSSLELTQTWRLQQKFYLLTRRTPLVTIVWLTLMAIMFGSASVIRTAEFLLCFVCITAMLTTPLCHQLLHHCYQEDWVQELPSKIKWKCDQGNEETDSLLVRNLKALEESLRKDEEELFGRPVAMSLKWLTASKVQTKLRIPSVFVPNLSYPPRPKHQMQWPYYQMQ